MTRRILSLALVLLICLPARAQDPSKLTLDRLFASGEFFGERFGPMRWLEDGSGYTTVESSDEVPGGSDIVRYNPATGERTVLIGARQLVPRGAERPLGIADYTWSPDGTKLLLFTNTRRVWRYNTKGDYWLLDLDTGALRQLGVNGPESTMMFAKFSPDGTRVGYVRLNNVYVEDVATGAITPLTTDGSTTIINGTFDWVHEEEFDLRDGFRWSPDGTKIAYWQLDASGIGVFLLINNTDSLYSKTIPVQYPKTGTTNSASRIGVVPASGGETVWIQDADDHRNHYPARMDWADNSDELIIQHLNRRQNENDVRIARVSDGSWRSVFTDRDDAWLDTVDDLIWFEGSRRFTWVSDRAGWKKVYLVDRATGELELLTAGEYDVERIHLIDEAGGWVYFTTGIGDATRRYLYRVRIGGDGTPELLTPVDARGWNDYDVSPDAKWAFHTHSTLGSPPTIDLVSLPDHQVVRSMVENTRLQETVDALDLGEESFFQVETAEGVTLDGWMIKPTHFDPSKKYPILFFVYGEPAAQTVKDQWGGVQLLWHHMIAEQGYLVISLDNRGTPGPKGRAWRKSVYGNIGTISSQDQAGALAEISKWPYVDPSRIGVWGWSGGGSNTLNMMFRYPDLYHVGMSVAPVPDQRYYDTIYQERYSGIPQEMPESYRNGSPITFAQNLKGDLLIVHGTGDDNVHYQGTEALINKLIAHGKQFEMMAYPNRSHGIYEGAGTTLHLRTLLTNYLFEHLEAGGR